MFYKKPLSLQTIVLHWTTGLMFIAIFILGLYMVELPKGPDKFELIGLHKSLGALILIIAITRIVWRIKEGAIKPASIGSAWQNRLANIIHGLLMLATLTMPLSGIAMSVGGGRGADIFGWQLIAKGDSIPWLQELGSMVHGLSVNIIIALLTLHILGAIKHQIIDRDNTMARMLGRID